VLLGGDPIASSTSHLPNCITIELVMKIDVTNDTNVEKYSLGMRSTRMSYDELMDMQVIRNQNLVPCPIAPEETLTIPRLFQ
jgi:hypothetical protein